MGSVDEAREQERFDANLHFTLDAASMNSVTS
jgi:hypothetical protein